MTTPDATLNSLLDEVVLAMSSSEDMNQKVAPILVGLCDVAPGLSADDPAAVDSLVIEPWIAAVSADLAETGHRWEPPPIAELIELGLGLHADLWEPLRADLASAAPLPPESPREPPLVVFANFGDRTHGCLRRDDHQDRVTAYRDQLRSHGQKTLAAARDRLREQSLRRAGDARPAVEEAFRRLGDHPAWQGATQRVFEVLESWAQACLDIAAHLHRVHSIGEGEENDFMGVLRELALLLGRTRPSNQTAGIPHHGPLINVLKEKVIEPWERKGEDGLPTTLDLGRVERELLLEHLKNTTRPRDLLHLLGRDPSDSAPSLLGKLRLFALRHHDIRESRPDLDPHAADYHDRRRELYAPPRGDSRSLLTNFRRYLDPGRIGAEAVYHCLVRLIGKFLAQAIMQGPANRKQPGFGRYYDRIDPIVALTLEHAGLLGRGVESGHDEWRAGEPPAEPVVAPGELRIDPRTEIKGADDASQPRRFHPPTATIIGAGVTGLTAAHELAERGFRVQVVERRIGPDRQGRRELVVGGIAASQWSRPPREASAPIPGWPARAAEVRHRDEAGFELLCEKNNGALRDPLAAFAALQRLALRLPLRLPRGESNRWSLALEGKHAERIRALLLAITWTLRPRGSVQPDITTNSTGAHDRVTIRVTDTALPGEHGYRFFPSFYHHLFDTMRRTPLYDAEGHETERTVFDNLVPTESQLFSGVFQSVGLRRGRPPSLEAFRRDLQRMLQDLGFDRQDIARFAARMLRLMTSSKERRAHYEELSWWEFLIARGFAADGQPRWRLGDDAAQLRPRRQSPDDGRPRDPRSPYSPDFEAQLKAAPQALVAMDAELCDARTQGNIVIQLMLDQLLDRSERTDCTLNGPTTTAWLDPWRRHLERLGVRFFQGELEAISRAKETDDGETGDKLSMIWKRRPTPSGATSEGFESNDDYIVVATDAVAAERLSRRIRLSERSVPSRLAGFTTQILRRDPASGRLGPGEPRSSRAFVDPRSGQPLPWPLFGRTAEDRFQIFSGIQYYFRQDLELGRGHVYYQDSSWGLSSISPLQFWRRRAELRDRGILGILSVDIGNFRQPSRYLGRPALFCRGDQIAKDVWRQMSERLRRSRDRLRPEGSQALPLPHPIYYHLDDHLLLGPDGCTTLAPFLVNQAGDWQRRPGVDPWDPAAPERQVDRGDDPHVWQAPHGGYQVHFDRLVFAGTYLRTFTRMTTMEAANESARHAVNAILDHLNARGARLRLQRTLGDPKQHPHPTPQGVASILDETAIAGDYCRIWDPERHELDDLEFFKRTDALLVAAGKPHMFDILGLEELVDRVLPGQDPLETLFSALGRTLRDDWGLGDGGDQGLGLGALRALHGRLPEGAHEELRGGLDRLVQGILRPQGAAPTLDGLRRLLTALKRQG